MSVSGEHRPLLPSDRVKSVQHATSSRFAAAREQVKKFLTSKAGHYSVLLLVTLDVACIFTDLILVLETCEKRVPEKDGNEAQSVLGIVSLVFSCLFMLELLASIWVFGWRCVVMSQLPPNDMWWLMVIGTFRRGFIV
jgi:voltage-gated hydrogen channel 1